MLPVSLTDSAGAAHRAAVPAHWGEVPLAPYAHLAAAGPGQWTAICPALAALVGVPAHVLADDMRQTKRIIDAAPWLLAGPLPDATAPLETFAFEGTTYQHTGHLHQLTGGQYEALTAFLAHAHDTQQAPVRLAPQLLAVLYQPAGAPPPTVDSVTALAATFERLPISLAWPAFGFFLRQHSPTSLASIRAYFAARAALGPVLTQLEQTLTTPPPTASRGTCWSLRRWLMRMWTRHARKALAASSTRSTTTAPRPSRPATASKASANS